MRDNDCCSSAKPSYGGCCRDEEPMPMMESEYPRRVKAKEINIQPMDHGYVIRVGCQSFVFETAEKMILNLDAYLADPDGVEKAWLSRTLVL